VSPHGRGATRAWLGRRLLAMVPTFLGITVVTFAVIHLVPGEPAAASELTQSAQLSRESLEAFRRAMGLDQPLHVRYLDWLGRVVRLDFGVSLWDHRPVIDKIAEALPNTLLLSGLALVVSWGLAVPLGMLAAVRRGGALDRLLSAGAIGLYSVPSFWMAILLLLLLGGGRYLDLFPIQGLHSADAAGRGAVGWLLDLGWHLVLPVFCLSYAPLAAISRYARSGTLEVLRQEYVRVARAKGLSEPAVLIRHVLPNAVIPLLTLLGLSLPGLVGGSVIVEQVFGIPGMGRLALQAMLTRDYATVMGVTTLTAVLTMVGTLVSDLLCALADPRIRYT
jgi:peptide/nickel transport system permease protein